MAPATGKPPAAGAMLPIVSTAIDLRKQPCREVALAGIRAAPPRWSCPACSGRRARMRRPREGRRAGGHARPAPPRCGPAPGRRQRPPRSGHRPPPRPPTPHAAARAGHEARADALPHREAPAGRPERTGDSAGHPPPRGTGALAAPSGIAPRPGDGAAGAHAGHKDVHRRRRCPARSRGRWCPSGPPGWQGC